MASGYCDDKCPGASRWSPTSRRCVTIFTRPTRPTTPSPTGTPDDLGDRIPALVVMQCGTYSAEQDAAWYLNTAMDRGALTDETDTTHYRVKMAQHLGNCPPSGLFEAGIDELIAKEIADHGKTKVNEHYQVRWTYDPRLFDTYGLVAVKPGGKFKDAPGPADFAPSDGCSDTFIPTPDSNNDWDRRVACGAHDYCVALVEYGVSSGLTKEDCDNWFESMMRVDCASRNDDLLDWCDVTAGFWAGAVDAGQARDFNGKIRFENVSTELCMDVDRFTSQATRNVIQSVCRLSQEFRAIPVTGVGFMVNDVATGLCLMTSDAEGKPVVHAGTQCVATLVRLVSDDGEDRYYMREVSDDLLPRCWAPLNTSVLSGISSRICASNDLYQWGIEEVGS